jgi:membrane-associated phospholipid phosphatase
MRASRAAAVTFAGSVLATALVWAVAFQTAAGARLDSAVLDGFTGLRGSRLEPAADVVAALAGPLPFAVMTLCIATIAVIRGLPRHALVVGLVAVAASVTTELLKPLATLSRPAEAPPLAPTVDGWPSGHMTAAMTVALCLVFVAPARLRPSAAAVGGLFAAAEGYAVLGLGWHYPSDVVASCAIATAWLALGVAALGDRRIAGTPRRPLMWPAGLAAVLVAALAAGAVVARPARVLDYAQCNTTVVVAAVALGSAALGLVAVAAAALTLSERRGSRADRAPSPLRA